MLIGKMTSEVSAKMAPTVTQAWHVGAIMNEPFKEVLKFCAWYLALGADELTICFDNPDDPAIEALSEHPRVRCIPCTPAFWQSLGLTAESAFVKRQNAALTWIYGQYPDGWLLNVDADEFMYFDGRGVADVLQQEGGQALSIRVITAERVIAPERVGETLFRRPMAYDVRKSVYGTDAKLFGPKRSGLVGHPQGKSFVRCGVAGLQLRQHWPRAGSVEPGEEVLLDHHDGAHLLHMIGADFEIWRNKLAWRCGSRGFTDPLTERIEAALASSQSETELRDLFSRLHALRPDQVTHLEREDALLRLEWDLTVLVQREFGIDLERIDTPR